ncbi:TIGR03086 family metal-binding protein [Jannaschia sp. R86511]|uniref:TIGR03086 family metal-binding protein n=1 Tax=Jannaschia sp. R86511 TaxID=3093853 RepID=UPI0036D32381
MGLPTDEVARFDVVAARFCGLVRGTTDWSAPAPVDGWVARDVVEHLVTWLPGLLGAHGVQLGAAPVDAGPVARWEAHAVAVRDLLADPASRDRLVQDPHFPPMSLTQVVDRLWTTDVFLHSWDLARATGQEPGLDPEHCLELLAGMEPAEQMMRSSGQYGPRVAVPEDADPQTRLVAFVGRDPAWSAPPT